MVKLIVIYTPAYGSLSLNKVIVSISVQGQHASKRDNFPIFCVILNQRTSSTLHSSALKMGKFSPLEVGRVRNRSDDASARHLNEVYWTYTD